MLSFNLPPFAGKEFKYMEAAVQNRKISGDGEYTKRCSEWLERRTGTSRALLTTSCTHALEMAAMLCGIQPGDEVIMPSFTFCSGANAFVLRGAKIVFVDIRPETMNMDERLVEEAITEKTRVIAPVHYAGISCRMEEMSEIAKRHHLKVVEDAAQGIMASYKGRSLGTIGDFGCLSFHETKNLSMGEGGALLIQDAAMAERAEIIREKGTDRSRFFRGQVDKYCWQEAGSSYLPSELNAAYLWAQMEVAEEITQNRLRSWKQYEEELKELAAEGRIELPFIPADCEGNGHIFFIKAKDMEERGKLIQYLKEQGIQSVFHYIPLHSAPAGLRYGRFHGEDRHTTRESNRLLRLPLYYKIGRNDISYVCDKIREFYRKNPA